MKQFTILALLFSCHFCFAQNIQWEKVFGGTSNDGYSSYTSIQPTADGGYILVGTTNSNDGDVSGSYGSYDVWVAKLNSNGTIQWQKALGGTGWDEGHSIQVTSDGGYILVGYTTSNDGDVIGNDGGVDVWVVKLTSTGAIQWQKTLGGVDTDQGNCIQATPDGGYILTGQTWSNDGDVSGNHGNDDVWVVKLSSSGTIQWQKALGGTDEDEGNYIQSTPDGGYILAGRTWSNNGNVTGYHGNLDAWVVKLTAMGAIQWQKALGGTDIDKASCVEPTSDGGYVLSGVTHSFDGDLSSNHGVDAWVVKLSSNGTIDWQKTLGGGGGEEGTSIKPTSDGGYILGGYASSNDGDVSVNHGIYDVWVVKLNAIGNIQWEKSLGGTSMDYCFSIDVTSDGGYILAGSTNSNDGDISGNHGASDFWVVKLDNSWVGVTEEIYLTDLNISPNPIIEDKITLNYYLSEPTNIEIVILDLLGNIVQTEKGYFELVGKHQKDVKLEGIASGSYLLQVKTKYGNYVAKIVKN